MVCNGTQLDTCAHTAGTLKTAENDALPTAFGSVAQRLGAVSEALGAAYTAVRSEVQAEALPPKVRLNPCYSIDMPWVWALQLMWTAKGLPWYLAGVSKHARQAMSQGLDRDLTTSSMPAGAELLVSSSWLLQGAAPGNVVSPWLPSSLVEVGAGAQLSLCLLEGSSFESALSAALSVRYAACTVCLGVG